MGQSVLLVSLSLPGILSSVIRLQDTANLYHNNVSRVSHISTTSVGPQHTIILFDRYANSET